MSVVHLSVSPLMVTLKKEGEITHPLTRSHRLLLPVSDTYKCEDYAKRGYDVQSLIAIWLVLRMLDHRHWKQGGWGGTCPPNFSTGRVLSRNYFWGGSILQCNEYNSLLQKYTLCRGSGKVSPRKFSDFEVSLMPPPSG